MNDGGLGTLVSVRWQTVAASPFGPAIVLLPLAVCIEFDVAAASADRKVEADQRVIAIGGELTPIVLGLAAGRLLVGVDMTSTWLVNIYDNRPSMRS